MPTEPTPDDLAADVRAAANGDRAAAKRITGRIVAGAAREVGEVLRGERKPLSGSAELARGLFGDDDDTSKGA